ncbi:hypothetical protein B4096_3336 [Heyndrickxia coagulans]|nr:hypothetical protein B4096_3336 [Heyndrickxia coagulans]
MSFISPCCLPLYPAFVSYITGASVSRLKSGGGMREWKSILHTVWFLAGFSTVFIALGFGASWIGSFFIRYQDVIRQLGAVALIFFGLLAAGIFHPGIFMKVYRIDIKKQPAGFLGSFLVGLVFAAGWTPCTGPILASVLAMAVAPIRLLRRSIWLHMYLAFPYLFLSLLFLSDGWGGCKNTA